MTKRKLPTERELLQLRIRQLDEDSRDHSPEDRAIAEDCMSYVAGLIARLPPEPPPVAPARTNRGKRFSPAQLKAKRNKKL